MTARTSRASLAAAVDAARGKRDALALAGALRYNTARGLDGTSSLAIGTSDYQSSVYYGKIEDAELAAAMEAVVAALDAQRGYEEKLAARRAPAAPKVEEDIPANRERFCPECHRGIEACDCEPSPEALAAYVAECQALSDSIDVKIPLLAPVHTAAVEDGACALCGTPAVSVPGGCLECGATFVAGALDPDDAGDDELDEPGKGMPLPDPVQAERNAAWRFVRQEVGEPWDRRMELLDAVQPATRSAIGAYNDHALTIWCRDLIGLSSASVLCPSPLCCGDGILRDDPDGGWCPTCAGAGVIPKAKEDEPFPAPEYRQLGDLARLVPDIEALIPDPAERALLEADYVAFDITPAFVLRYCRFLRDRTAQEAKEEADEAFVAVALDEYVDLRRAQRQEDQAFVALQEVGRPDRWMVYGTVAGQLHYGLDRIRAERIAAELNAALPFALAGTPQRIDPYEYRLSGAVTPVPPAPPVEGWRHTGSMRLALCHRYDAVEGYTHVALFVMDGLPFPLHSFFLVKLTEDTLARYKALGESEEPAGTSAPSADSEGSEGQESVILGHGGIGGPMLAPHVTPADALVFDDIPAGPRFAR